LMNLLPRVCRMGSLRHLLPSGFLLEARGMKLRPVTWQCGGNGKGGGVRGGVRSEWMKSERGEAAATWDI
jgi:hypothetical protein